MRTRRSQSSSDSMPPRGIGHIPVLLHEVVAMLDVHPNDIVLDATLGGGGHARALAEKLGSEGVFVGFDLDTDAVERARAALSEIRSKKILIQANFRDMLKELAHANVEHLTKALFDLGWSSYQVDANVPGQGKGFSFQKDEPLLMTYGDSQTLTARTIVNEWSEKSIADVIWGWGEERYARRIARAVVEARVRKPIETSRELAEIISASVPSMYRKGRIHPATRTFQAIRIAVNDELGALQEGLNATWEKLLPGGRIAVITFHSIEDRIVKRCFADLEKKGEGKRISKKPISPTEEEIRTNPRSRSAKLRVIQKN